MKPEIAATRRDQVLALCLVTAILLFYRWTVTSNTTDAQPLFPSEAQGDYYQLLTDGFLHGHLYLPIAPDPRLLAAKDPFDPRQRNGAELPHDTSLYHGHIYINYGVTPVVVLRLPWRWLTRHDLPQNYAVLIFTGGGFVASAVLWLALRRRYFPDSGAVVLVAGISVLGLAAMTHAVLRRPSLWEEPIAAGYCLAMLMLGCIYRAWHSRRMAAWLFAAGLCLGLAVGARANYVAGVAAFAVPGCALWWRGRREGHWRWIPNRQWWGRAAALGGGFALVMAGLAWYNFARFGDPFEFGTTYQFTNPYGAVGKLFSLRLVKFNAIVYFFAPAQWSRYFPFAKMIHPPPVPAAYSGIEYVYGLFANFPFAWLAFLAPLAWQRRSEAQARDLRAFVGTTALFFASVCGLLLTFVSATGRYMVDFTPTLMLLACIGLLGAERLVASPWRTGLRWVGGLAAAFSVFVGVMLNFQVHDLLRQSNSALYRRLSHGFDLPVYAAERLGGTQFGPLEIALRFPRGLDGKLQLLLTTGWDYESDYVLVNYIDRQHVKLGFHHTNYAVDWSPLLPVDFGTVHRLQVQMGSLFPPLGHPYFDGKSHAAVADISRGLRISLDGQTAFDARRYFYDGSPGSLHVADHRAGAPFPPFSGTILSVRRMPYTPPPEGTTGDGVVQLKLSFPSGVINRGLPLLVTGETGRGDVLFLRFVRPGVVHFCYDHWGIGLWESGDVPVAEGAGHRLRILMPSLAPFGPEPGAKAELDVDLDGKRVWTARVPAYPADPRDIYIGQNGIGASSCEQEFPEAISRVSSDAKPAGGA